MARGLEAELFLLQVVVPSSTEPAADTQLQSAQHDLEVFAHELAGSRGRARVVVDDDPASAILEAVAAEQVDVVALGNLGMRGRKKFLLNNIPNRVSHNARCTVLIVNTAEDGSAPIGTRAPTRREEPGAVPPDAHLIGRTWRILRVL